MNEKTSRRFWVSMIVGFFAIDIVIATIAITMAVQDPSFRSIPGFSQRSVNWGEQQERQKTLSRLGWSIEVDQAHTTPQLLALQVLDRDGQNVKGIQLNATIFHYSRVAEQQNAILSESESLYVAPFDLSKPGNWNVDIEGLTANNELIWTQMKMERPRTP